MPVHCASITPFTPLSRLALARLGFTLSLSLAFLPLLGWFLGQRLGAPGVWAWLTPFAVFFLIGPLDAWIGHDTANPTPDEVERLGSDRWLRALPVLALPLCLLLVGWGAWAVAQSESLIERLGLTVSVGIITGALGITAAHELIHMRARRLRDAGGVLLALVCYGTFKIEHVRGHHVTVSTPEDRSSAPLGQSLYAFLPVSILSNVRAAWRLEAVRLRTRAVPVWSLANEVLMLTAASAATAGALWLHFGLPGLAFFLGQSGLAIVLLEVVNYIQHYGLERRRQTDGRYERTTMLHSWNSPFRLTNWYLFNLQRHSDHHAHAHRPYAVLRHHEASPQMPAGYAGMVLMALVPPLWFRVMDARVAACRAAVAGRTWEKSHD